MMPREMTVVFLHLLPLRLIFGDILGERALAARAGLKKMRLHSMSGSDLRVIVEKKVIPQLIRTNF